MLKLMEEGMIVCVDTCLVVGSVLEKERYIYFYGSLPLQGSYGFMILVIIQHKKSLQMSQDIEHELHLFVTLHFNEYSNIFANTRRIGKRVRYRA